jgi:hypothetical protein
MKKIFAALFIILTMSSAVIGQLVTNREVLLQFAAEKEKEWKQMQKRAEAYSKQHQVSLRTELADGTVIQLIDVINDKPVYFITDNLGAAITTRVNQLWEGGSTGLALTGEGYDKLGEWDGGAVRRTHQEFTDQGSSRVVQADNATSQSAHATHVAGTLVGAGVVAGAKGMSFAGQLKAYDWNNDNSEMAAAAANGLEISNHSYGQIRGWRQGTSGWDWYGTSSVSPVEDYLFGFYGSRSRDWDIIAYNAPNYLITKSAGNDRGEGPSNAGQDGNPEKDGGNDGYDCIGDGGTAKNILTVGAVREVLNYTGPSSVIMSSFSGWGPADDGRIKPDVVAKGVDLYSPVSTNNTSYSTYSGTSMSSPNTAGTMALLQLHYQNTHNGDPMRASTLKALVIHTADEAGTTSGPDYKFGWGLVNAERAANLISDDNLMQNVIDELTLNDGNAYQREVVVGGEQPLVATICWTDPAGNIPSATLNPRTPVLVNDLDIRIVDSNGTSFYPYSLNPENPDLAATTTGKNYVDNVEKIVINNPEPGTYTVIIDHDGPLTNGLQVFSLILSGIDEYTGLPLCSEGLINPAEGSSGNLLNQTIRWQAAEYATSYDVYFGTDGAGTEPPTNLINGENQQETFFTFLLEPGNTYYLKVIPRNNQGENETCSSIWSFETMPVISQYPYFVDVEQVQTPNLPEFWQSLNYSQAKWLSTSLIGYSGARSLACYNTAGLIPIKMNNWLVSPPFGFESGKEYYVTYYYRNFLPTAAESFSILAGNQADTTSLSDTLFSYSGVVGNQWTFGEFVYQPGFDGYGFFGWKLHSESGYGIILDDIRIDDWGPVGNQEMTSTGTRVFYRDNRLFVSGLDKNQSYNIQISNTAGQLVFEQPCQNSERCEITLNVPEGVYVAQVNSQNSLISRKFIIR